LEQGKNFADSGLLGIDTDARSVSAKQYIFQKQQECFGPSLIGYLVKTTPVKVTDKGNALSSRFCSI
jgi:hypothetical protein